MPTSSYQWHGSSNQRRSRGSTRCAKRSASSTDQPRLASTARMNSDPAALRATSTRLASSSGVSPPTLNLQPAIPAWRYASISRPMSGCKFKVGGLTPEEDAKRVEVARKAAGAAFILAVDANRGWSADDAVRFARLVEPLDIRWFEEPCHWYDEAAMMARVRQATRIPVTAGQSEITSHGVRRLIDARAVDLVHMDASECGGVTRWGSAAALRGAGRGQR